MRELHSSRRASSESQHAVNNNISPPTLCTLQVSLDNIAMVGVREREPKSSYSWIYLKLEFSLDGSTIWPRTTNTVQPLVLEWREWLCSQYRMLLLKGELATWCCDRGRKMLPQLPELSAYFTNCVNSRTNYSSSNS